VEDTFTTRREFLILTEEEVEFRAGLNTWYSIKRKLSFGPD
jgi:hypothetical protein